MNKWYQSKLCKWILIGVVHVAAVILLVTIFQLGEHRAINFDTLFSTETAKEYEDSEGFEELVYQDAHEVLEYIDLRKDFETDGEYNPDQMVDIMEGTIVEEDVEEVKEEEDDRILYKLGDLVKGYEGVFREGESTYVVCQKPDDSYYYYVENEFVELLSSGELILSAAEGADLDLDEEGYGYYESYSGEVTDEKGTVLYKDFWSLYTSIDAEEFMVGDKPILDILNESKKWNGHMDEILQSLETEACFWGERYWEYTETYDFLREGNSNITYLMVDKSEEKVYTNRKEYDLFDEYKHNIENIKEDEKYVILSPTRADFDTNIAAVNINEWSNNLHVGDKDGDYIFMIAIDTTYPIQDDFYTASVVYSDYSPLLLILSIATLLVSLVWLTLGAGRSKEQEGIVLHGFDKWKTELAAGLVIFLWIFSMWLFGNNLKNVVYVNGYAYVYRNNGAYVICVIMALITASLFLIGYLSLVRRIKAKTFWSNSILNWLLKHLKKVWIALCEIVKSWPSTWKLILAGLGVMIIHWIAFSSYSGSFTFFTVILEFAVLAYLLLEAISRQKIRKGLKRIVEGEIDYQIPLDGLKGDYVELAERINNIGEGLDAAIEKSMRDERLKTDLITNVSHDIKTPLTSIINYVDLLKRENFKDPKIQGYLDVLESKAQRLKALTEDVVEASKVSSGNVNLELMNVDIVELVNQVNGEFAERFEQKKLQMIMKLPEKAILVYVDGKRMWRILENIYSNAAKYAMEGTRIYGDMNVIGGEAVFSLKNVSANELNISPDELTERFIRGDDSRTTEGSGLGLSIAKSLAELQGGKFNIEIDGDLFKVILRFPKVDEGRK